MQYERSSTQVLVLVCKADSMKEGFCNPFFKTLVTLVTESLSIMKLGMIERLCARGRSTSRRGPASFHVRLVNTFMILGTMN